MHGILAVMVLLFSLFPNEGVASSVTCSPGLKAEECKEVQTYYMDHRLEMEAQAIKREQILDKILLNFNCVTSSLGFRVEIRCAKGRSLEAYRRLFNLVEEFNDTSSRLFKHTFRLTGLLKFKLPYSNPSSIEDIFEISMTPFLDGAVRSKAIIESNFKIEINSKHELMVSLPMIEYLLAFPEHRILRDSAGVEYKLDAIVGFSHDPLDPGHSVNDGRDSYELVPLRGQLALLAQDQDTGWPAYRPALDYLTLENPRERLKKIQERFLTYDSEELARGLARLETATKKTMWTLLCHSSAPLKFLTECLDTFDRFLPVIKRLKHYERTLVIHPSSWDLPTCSSGDGPLKPRDKRVDIGTDYLKGAYLIGSRLRAQERSLRKTIKRCGE